MQVYEIVLKKTSNFTYILCYMYKHKVRVISMTIFIQDSII